MKQTEAVEIFCENLERFKKSIKWLRKSFEKCKNIELKDLELISEEELESLEALANRFGRSVDIMINKVLRGLDIVELEDTSRKLDLLIRAEKRGFVENYEELIAMKDLRNELVHEYIDETLIDMFKEILKEIPVLLSVYDRILKYVDRYDYCKKQR